MAHPQCKYEVKLKYYDLPVADADKPQVLQFVAYVSGLSGVCVVIPAQKSFKNGHVGLLASMMPYVPRDALS